MEITVSDILATRVRAGDPPRGVSVVLSVLFHGSFLVLLLLISKPKKLAFVPTIMPVRVVSGGSLARQAPAPVAVAAKPKPAIEKPNQDAPASPTQMKLPVKTKEKEKPVPVAARAETKAPVAAAPKDAGPQIDAPTVPGNGGGDQGGTASFGASVSAFDVDFPYAYYAEQLVSLIGANWLKPNTPDGTACVVSFKILRSGQVTDVKVDATSGFPFFDRAASRAVYQANPLPPLPPEFKGDSLGVHIKFL